MPKKNRNGSEVLSDGPEAEKKAAAPKRKIPSRRCTGCGQSKPKSELIRVVRSPEGELSIDPGGKAAGRGAYICRDAVCFRSSRKAKRLDRSLDCAVPEEIYGILEKMIEGDGGK